MWRYVPYPKYHVDKPLVRSILKGYRDEIPKVTNETISYINTLLSPYLTQLNTIISEDDLVQFMNSIPEYNRELIPDSLNANKNAIFRFLVESLLWNNFLQDDITTYSDDIIDPWILKNFIRNNRRSRKILGFPPHQYDDLSTEELEDPDPDYETTPVTIPVNVNNTVIEMSYDLLLGIMVVYRYLHKMHPLSYQGWTFATEMEIVNSMSFKEKIEPSGGYSVNVGDTYYRFQSLDFFQGLLTGARGNNIDPHTFITNLKRWNTVKENYPDHIPGTIPNIGQFPVYRKISTDLDY